MRPGGHARSYRWPVDLSGLIFVALAVVWAVVLIPMALRHHDEAARTRAVDSFSDDLRVVARREAVTAHESRLVAASRGPGPRDSRSTPAEVPPGVPPVATPVVPRQRQIDRVVVTRHRTAARTAAKRRRIVLALLLTATAGVGVAAGVGVLLPWTPAVPAAIVLGFLALARVLVRREEHAWRRVTTKVRADDRSVAPAATTPSPQVVVPAVTTVSTAGAVLPTPELPLPVVSGLDDTCAVPVGLVAEALGSSPTPEGLWDPLPVTLPTYVTKPRAPRSVRTIDLLEPGVVSSGRSAADSALVAEAATAAPEEGQPSRRAVGH